MLLLSILATLYRVMVGVSNFFDSFGSAFPWRFGPKKMQPFMVMPRAHPKSWKLFQVSDIQVSDTQV